MRNKASWSTVFGFNEEFYATAAVDDCILVICNSEGQLHPILNKNMAIFYEEGLPRTWLAVSKILPALPAAGVAVAITNDYGDYHF